MARVFAFAWLILLLPSASFSEDKLGLLEFWGLALKNHEQIGIGGESVEQAKGDISRAYSKTLPTLTLEGNYTRYTEEKRGTNFLVQPESASRFEVRLNQPIYSGGKEWSLLRQVKKTLLSSEVMLDDIKEYVLMETSIAYYTLLRTEKEAEIKEASLKRAEEHLRAAQARFKVGSSTKAAVLRAEAEAALKTAELVKAKAGIKDALEALRRLTGIEGDFDAIEVVGRFSNDKEVNELVKSAFEKRRDYRQKVISEEIALEGIRYAKGWFYPTLSLEGTYMKRDQTPKTTFFLDESSYAAITLSFPIFEGGLRTAELKQARSKHKQSELERLALKREVELDVRLKYNAMEAIGSIIVAHGKQVTYAEENYAVVFKQYKYGAASSTDLVDADTLLTAAQLDLMRSVYDYELSILELKRSAGLLLEEAETALGGLHVP